MRIALVNHEFTITGSSTALFRLATHLQGQGHTLTVLPCNPADGPIASRYAAAGIPIVSSLPAADIDLVIANTICAAPVLLSLPPGLPVLWFVNEAEVGLDLLSRYPEWRQAFRRADAVIFNMPFQRDVYRSFTWDLDPAKFHVIPFGVDVDPAMAAHDRVPPKRQALRVVQVGTIEPRKRAGELMRAVAQSGLDIECVVCGTFFWLHPAALALVEAEPARYRLLSGLDDAEVLAWVASADVFCLASSSETQALAVYEAAALARPLLLSDLPCYRDVFRHGHNCLLFPPGHTELLARSLGMLAASPALRQELGQAAHQTSRRFSNRRFFDRFDLVLRDVAQAPAERQA